MSLTNTYEDNILRKLTGTETDSWVKPYNVGGDGVGKLYLKLYTTSPGEEGTSGAAADHKDYVMDFNAIASSSQSRTYSPTANEKFEFNSTTTAEVTTVGLVDSNSNVIWTEALTGSAVRAYADVDLLHLTNVVFSLTGTALCRDLASAVLDHIFSKDKTFAPLDFLYLAFYNGDPGFNGDSGTEVGTRLRIEKTAWTVSNGTAFNTDKISQTFTSGGTVTHVALRSSSLPGDKIYWRGPLLSPQVMAVNDLLVVQPGQLALAID